MRSYYLRNLCVNDGTLKLLFDYNNVGSQLVIFFEDVVGDMSYKVYFHYNNNHHFIDCSSKLIYKI